MTADWDGVGRIAVVGPLAYLAVLSVLRVAGKRTLSKMSAFDFVVTIALGSILASVILDHSVTLMEGVTGFAVLVLGQFVVSWLSVRHPWFERLVKSEPTLVFDRGRALPSAMKRARVTERDIEAAARNAGVEPSRVEAMVLETDGTMSVLAGRTPSSA